MRLLIVEDEADLLQSLTLATRDEGYAVDTAADGEDGLYKALHSDYDCILLDVMLPRLNGMELLRRLRAERRTPVLLLTARDATSDRVRGLDGGADDYLVKPFDLEELMARLRALIRRHKGQTTSRITVGEYELNLSARTLSKAGQAVALTAREYSLLEYLALRRGSVVSRTELYEHLFDENDETLSNLLDVHVSKLRRKLGADLIETRRGMGYSLAG
jgi:two-component system OmpR family response regulator